MTGARWTARVRAGTDGPAGVHARGHSLLIDSPLGLGVHDDSPCAIDHLLAALGGDLILRLQVGLRRAGLDFDSLELSLHATLENPLVALGVVGETGSPALARVGGSCYLTSAMAAADLPMLEEAWLDAQARSPLLQTLRRACEVAIELKPL